MYFYLHNTTISRSLYNSSGASGTVFLLHNNAMFFFSLMLQSEIFPCAQIKMLLFYMKRGENWWISMVVSYFLL